ncbi:TIGR00288 family NYN domain-containing protein [Candidatus Micrarchaeota archaeon]|nr:TIGR00288 family NYN domain-containing protein [Candidatus Micrarchaeota archaeon]
MGIFDSILPKKNRIAILVDGPNSIRKKFNIDLKEVRKELSQYGEIRIAKIYLDQYASEKLIEAMVNQGFDTVITTGDVDVTMAIEAMEYVLDPSIDIIALMTRDTDFRPVLIKARAKGKKTIIVATDIAFSVALKNTADTVIVMKGRGEAEHVQN